MGEAQVTPGFLQIPGWDWFPWLRAGFSTRQGGDSQAYGPNEQNLGWTAEDDPAVIARNRAAFFAAIANNASIEPVTLQQIHGCAVRDMDREPGPLMSPEGKALLQGDGMMTGTPGRMLGILTADCVPVLVADPQNHAVAAFHAGWRGTLARIVEGGISAMAARFGSDPSELLAAIGPSIGSCCFAVGGEVRTQFLSAFSYGAELFNEVPAHVASSSAEDIDIHLDLTQANQRQLLAAGLPGENISLLSECTACTRLEDGRRKYFSHRSERGVTGRMMSAIAIVTD